MRILQVNDNYEGGGASILMRQLAKILTRRGHEVYFAVSRTAPANNVYKIHHLNGILFHLVRRLVFFNVDPLAYCNFEKIVKKIKPDIVHCHNLATRLSLEIVKVSLRHEIPCIVTLHDYWPVCLNRTLLKGSWRKPHLLDVCEETGWNRCAFDCKWEALKKAPNIIWGMSSRKKLLSSENIKLIAVSDYTKSVLERFGYPQVNIEVIRNGVDTSMFRPLPYKDKRTVLYLGGDFKPKGLKDFIKMAKKIKRHKRNARFVILGGKVACAPDFTENPGRIPFNNMINYYEKALCVCIPSLFPEPLSLGGLESMACGRPVVAYALGGLIEIVKNGETGFLVEPGNLNKLTETVLWLLNNVGIARNLGLKARKFVEKNHNLEKVCDNYQRIYYEMINSWSEDALRDNTLI